MSLEGRYRRLLVAYPQSYRERRGEEIIATLMDDAQPGQSHPDRREILDLVLGGLRERLGLNEPEGLAAGAALVSPVCLAIAVGYAAYFPILGLTEPVVVALALAWIGALAVWSVLPQWSVPALVAALAVTGVMPFVDQLGVLFIVAPWGVAALLGEISAAGTMGRRTPWARLVAPVVAAVMAVLILLPGFLMIGPDDSAYLPTPPLWIFLVKDVLALVVAVVIGVGMATWRRSGRLAWAAFVLLAAWSLSITSEYVYYVYGSSALDLVNRPEIRIGLAVLTIGLTVLAVRAGGAGIPTLRRAGSLAVGFVGGTAALVAGVVIVDGDRTGTPPVEVMAWGLLAVPALTDHWVAATVQRWLLILTGGTFAVVQVTAGDYELGPAQLILLLVLGLATRGHGHPRWGGVVGFAIGVVVGAAGLWFSGPLLMGSDPVSVGLTNSAVMILTSAVTVGAAVVLIARDPESWFGPTAFTVGALWVVVPNATVAAAIVIVAGVSMAAVAVARMLERLRDQGGGPSSVIELG
jgi:hypothetical protein